MQQDDSAKGYNRLYEQQQQQGELYLQHTRMGRQGAREQQSLRCCRSRILNKMPHLRVASHSQSG